MSADNLHAMTPTASAAHALDRSLANEERLRMAMAAAKIGAFDWNVKTNELTWSANLETLMGLPAGSFGNRLEDFLAFVHPDDRTKVRQTIDRTLKTGAEYQMEFRMVRGDGTERWAQARGQVQFDEHGEPARIVGIDIDITESKRRELELERNRDRLSMVQDVANAGVFERNLRTNRVVLTPELERMLGFAPGEFSGEAEQFYQRVHPEDLAALREKTKAALSSGTLWTEFRVVRPDGTTCWMEVFGKVIYSRDGEPESLYGINVNITGRKEADEALRRSEAQAKARAAELDAILDAVPAMLFIANDPDAGR